MLPNACGAIEPANSQACITARPASSVLFGLTSSRCSARYRPTKLWRAAGLIQAGPGTPPQ